MRFLIMYHVSSFIGISLWEIINVISTIIWVQDSDLIEVEETMTSDGPAYKFPLTWLEYKQISKIRPFNKARKWPIIGGKNLLNEGIIWAMSGNAIKQLGIMPETHLIT